MSTAHIFVVQRTLDGPFIFYCFTYPVNVATKNWTAGITFAAFCLSNVAALNKP